MWDMPGQGQVALNSIQMGMGVSSCCLIIQRGFFGQTRCTFWSHLLLLSCCCPVRLRSISKAAHVLTNNFLPLQIYSPSRKDSGARQTEKSSEKIKASCGVVTTRCQKCPHWGRIGERVLPEEASGNTCCVGHVSSCHAPLCCDASGLGAFAAE